MERDIQIQPDLPKEKRSGCLGELGWFASGSILPLFSLYFYRKASERKVGLALLFFLAFTLGVSILSTVGLGLSMAGVTQEIRQAFDDGAFPEITIADGVAQVDAPTPLILFDEDTGSQITFVAIDTTGKIREIDRYQYSQGILLTRAELHVLNNARYEVLPLHELNRMFEKDPIIINAETVTNTWITFSIGFSIIAFIFIFLWEAIARLMILALYALVLWGIVSLIRPNTKFDVIIISALYAIIPAIYLTYLCSRIGLRFPGLQTLILLPFWIAAMVAALSEAHFFSEERPLRLWTALIGLPMLVLLCIDRLLELPSPYGPASLWGLTMLTALLLVGVRLFFRYKDRKMNEPLQG